MRNYIYQRFHIVPRLSWSLLLILLLINGDISTNRVLATQNITDLLAFSTYEFDGKRSVILYDPNDGTSAVVLDTAGFLDIAFSVKGNLAYSTYTDGHDEIHISNALKPSDSPLVIRGASDANEYPLRWSRDGHYLAFAFYTNDEGNIYVWDGSKTIDITPKGDKTDRTFYNGLTEWSFDGRFAFTVLYAHGFPEEGDPSEIYLWDGKSTMNLSQNPTGEDEAPTWYSDGRLAFVSSRGILIWDGISFKQGAPNADTFISVRPELLSGHTYPVWTNDGSIAFESNGLRYNYVQIYKWDGKTITNLSQNPALHNGSQTWSADGRWAFSTYFSSQQLVQVRDADNRILYSDDGQWPRWSADGDLIFCRRTERGWSLLLWDGQQTREIVRGREIWAQWQSGATVTCTSG